MPTKKDNKSSSKTGKIQINYFNLIFIVSYFLASTSKKVLKAVEPPSQNKKSK